MLNANFAVSNEAGNRAGRMTPLEPVQVTQLAAVLSRAYFNEALFTYLMPNEIARQRFSSNFFNVAIRESQLHGEIQTGSAKAVALWIAPGRQLSLGAMMRSVISDTRHHWDWADLRRCLSLGAHLDIVHKRLVQEPHWYLLAIAADPSTGTESRQELMEGQLARADANAVLSYVETYSERDLPFYERNGFRIAGSGKTPKGGPDFWAMIRGPQ